MKGYIYLRNNELCILKKILKLGKTKNIKNRGDSYTTYEHEIGFFVLVIEIELNKIDLIEKMLKNYFQYLNNYKGHGLEYFDISIIDEIEFYFKKLNIEYKVLTKEEINLINRSKRIIKNNFKKILKNSLINKLKPLDHQKNILDKIDYYYSNNNIGKLIWSPGLGKTIMSLLIIKKLNFKKIIIGVPGKYLQKQFKDDIIKLFPNIDNILFIGGISEKKDIKEINSFLNKNNNQPKFIITTYNSCYLLDDLDINVDFKIGDECHHLVGKYTNDPKLKKFIKFHNIRSTKTLYMTGTEKNIEKSNETTYSMDDIIIFGKYIDQKSVAWAINNKKITDYNAVILKIFENELNEIILKLHIKIEHKELFLSAYMCLKSLEIYDDLTHMLNYTNNIQNAIIVENYINQLLDKNIFELDKNEIYNKSLNSKCKLNLEKEINEFKNKTYGIISCVYLFGEGFNEPTLNGVCFAENMESYNRIIQSGLRPNRLNNIYPNKKSYILLPCIDNENWLNNNNKSFDKIKEIVCKFRNIDETFNEKIKLLNYNEYKPHEKEKDTKYYTFNENLEQLNRIKIRLRQSNNLNLDFTEEQNEYNEHKEYNKENNITSKMEYYENIKKIDNPEDYFKNKGVWINWYDFFGYDTSIFIPSKDIWKSFCIEKNIKNIDEYNKICNIYKELPKNPVDFYVDFTNIENEFKLNNIRRK